MKNQLKILKALADKTRLRILSTLISGEKSVSEIIPTTKKSQPTVSLNLRLLENLGIVISNRRGKQVFYSLKEEKVKKIFKLLKL